MNNWCIFWFFTHILTKCTVLEAKSPVKNLVGSVARRDLIPALKGYPGNAPSNRITGLQFQTRRPCKPG
jgi:hypothetical protein